MNAYVCVQPGPLLPHVPGTVIRLKGEPGGSGRYRPVPGPGLRRFGEEWRSGAGLAGVWPFSDVRGRTWLRKPFDVPALAAGEPPQVDFNRIPLQGKDGLLAHLARVPDRRDVHGQRHSQVFILAIVACAVLAGMRGFRAAAHSCTTSAM